MLWFKDGTVILGHDSGLPLDPITHFIDRFYVWSQRFGIGTDQSYALLGAFFIHGFEAFLSFLGLSMQLEQKVQFIVWFTLPGLSMYFFVHKIWPEKRYLPLIASIIYMINYYLMQAWFIAERTKFSIYTALPLVLFFLISYLTKKMDFLPSVIFTGLTLGFLNAGGSIPLYGGLIVAVLITYIYINLTYLNLETLKRTIFFAIGVSIVYILLNSYWLISYFFYILSFYGRDLALAGGSEGVLTWVTYLSKGSTFLNLLRGQGIPEWYLNEFHPYADVLLNNPFFKIMSFTFPILAFFSLVIGKLNRDRFYIYLLIFIALAGIFLSAGTNSEFGFLFEGFVRYIPGFTIFRSAYYKFNYIYWFSYAILIGFTLDYLFTKISEKIPRIWILKSSVILIALFILIYLTYHYPITNGLFFDYNSNPNGKLTTRVNVPNYVFEFGDWVNSQDPNRRYLIFPEINDSGYISHEWGFWSLAPVNSLLSKNSFVQNTGLLPESERLLLKQMYAAFLNKDFDSFFDFADIFAIDSIVVQKDYDWKSSLWGTTDPAAYEKILLGDSRFRLEKEFGEWKVYKILGRDKNLRISVARSLNFIHGELGNVVSFPYFDPTVPLYISDTSNDSSFAKVANGIFIGTNCIGCDLKEEDTGFEVYNPTLLPGSLLYNFFITRSEEKIRERSNDFVSRVNYFLTTTDRRSVEIKWMVEFKQNLSNLQPTLVRHNQTLEELREELSSADWGLDSSEAEDLAKKVNGHLLTQSSLITSVHNDEMVTLENRLVLASSYEKLVDVMEMIKNKRWVTENESEKKYLFRLPVLGSYGIFVKKSTISDQTANTDKLSIFIRENEKFLKPISEVEDWINFGTLDINSNIIHLVFNDTTAKNLLENATPIFPPGNLGIIKLENSYAMTGDSINKCLSFPIKGLELVEKKKYIISFSYRNFTDDRTLSVSLDKDVRHDASLRTKETVLPSKQNWTSFKTSVLPITDDPVINFCNGFTSINELQGPGTWLNYEATNHGVIKPDDKVSYESGIIVTEIKDISFYEASEPNIILYKSGQGNKQNDVLIDFVKKNPVEYNVTLEKSESPVYLTMKESFGKYWQVCDGNGNCIPFDTKMHFANAGFLNTWYLKDGVSSKLNFYYYPQRTFIIGSIISFVSYVMLLGWILYRYLYKKNLINE